ncbi:thioredoxin family protein [Microcella pacifica]|uniref:Thioredoxin family protein n=1 Tax=Microcella pacifica TaxID=2591847 RepID=A0A9E5MK07_9MICO|nr:thioredoxin family protein [Microcella pacifica]NHF62539.1 thioredoxin family protein [Microcella pacifica]
MRLELYTSAFCEPCHRAREVVAEAARLVPSLRWDELDVAHHPERAEARGVTRTPTVVVLDDGGAVVVQAEGVPPLPRLLAALASAAD